MKGKVYNYFPGGNTSKGFFSFYKYIINQEDARRIICIKGGPGTGKSSLMKKTASYFNDKGYDIEMHHCSSDNNSIDGIVIKDLKVALLDGTAPHVVDPVNPGAVDEILNLGENWNEMGFKLSRKAIIKTNKEIGAAFQSAYKYLGAAKLIHDDWENQIRNSLNNEKINELEKTLLNKILYKNQSISSVTGGIGFQRHLFATAFTPEGIVTFIDKLIEDYSSIYVLNGPPGTNKSQLLNNLCSVFSKNGYYVEVFHQPLEAEKIEHILIPEINTAIVTSNEINHMDFSGNQVYMENFIEFNKNEYNKNRILETKETFNILINKALDLLKMAKGLHDHLETYYIPNMNFQEINLVYDSLIEKISLYEKEAKDI